MAPHIKNKDTYGEPIDGCDHRFPHGGHFVPVSQEVCIVTLVEGSVLHLLNVSAGCKTPELMFESNLTLKHTHLCFSPTYQQRLSRCLWSLWLLHHRLLRRCPAPGPPPSSNRHIERWELWVCSAGWSPRRSSHLAFPPRCIHTDHLDTRKKNSERTEKKHSKKLYYRAIYSLTGSREVVVAGEGLTRWRKVSWLAIRKTTICKAKS